MTAPSFVTHSTKAFVLAQTVIASTSAKLVELKITVPRRAKSQPVEPAVEHCKGNDGLVWEALR